MSQSFSGVEIRKQADLAVAAVKSIGGASRLTEQEQKKVNATVTEAIAKYRALGQAAPAELRKLQAETANVTKSTGVLSSAAAKAGALFAGAFTVGAIVNVSRKVLDLGGDLADLSAKTGIGVRALQEFKFAGGQVGVSLDAITTGINQMQNRIAEGDKSAVGALRRLNISMSDFKKLRPEDQFAAVADAIGWIQDPAEKVRTAMDLMGKSGAELLPVLTKGFDDVRESARRMGIVLDEETVAALDSMGDRLDALQGVYLAGFARLLVETQPLLEAFGSGLQNAGKWLDYMQDQFEMVILGAIDLTAEFAELEVSLYRLARATNPAAQLFGTFDAAMADAQKRADEARQTVKFMADSISKDTTRAILAIAKAGEVRGITGRRTGGSGGLAPSDAEIKRFKQWRDEVTGAATEKALQQLTSDWNRLTDAEQQSQPVREAVLAQYEKLRVSLPKVGGALESLRTSTLRVIQPNALLQEQLAAIASDAMPDANRMFAAGQAALNLFQRDGLLASRQVVSLSAALEAVPAELFTKNVRKMAGETLKFADVLEENLKVALVNVTGILADAIANDASFEEVAAKLGTEIGASIGASVGYAIGGPLGAAIGEQIGALLGPLLEKLIKTRAETTMERIGEELGITVTEAFAQGIEDTAKTLFSGNRQAARIFSLQGLIDQAGGLTADNFGPLIAEFRDLFSMVETGAFTAGQAIEVLDGNFRAFADFVTEGGSLATKELLEIIKLADEAGLKSAEIAAFTTGEANKALGGLEQFITKRGEIVDKLGEAQKRLDDLRRKAGDDSADISPEEIGKAADEVERLQHQLSLIPLTVAGAGAVGASLFAIFEQLTANGQPAIEVLQQIDPLIESLDRQLAAAGLSGGAAFDSLKSIADLATDETFGPAFEAISGLGSALEGLHNSGLLTQETFGGIAEQVTATFDGLIAQGVNGEKAMRLIQPTLQDLWELQKDFGYEVDDSTQKMLEEAEAAGLVGDEHRTATEQMLLLTERMVTAIEGIATLFGVDLVDAVGDFGEAVEDIPDPVLHPRIDWPDLELPDDYDRYPQPFPDKELHYASGGLVPKYLAGGGPSGSDTVPAWLTPGEFVMNRQAVSRIGASTLSAMNSGGGSSGPVLTIGTVYVNGRLDESAKQELTDYIATNIDKLIWDGGVVRDKWGRLVNGLVA